MDKYVVINKYHHHRWLQVYMYDFMYVDTEIMEEGK